MQANFKPVRQLTKALPLVLAAAGVVWFTCGARGKSLSHSTLVAENSRSQKCDNQTLSQFEAVFSVESEVTQVPAGHLLYRSAELHVEARSDSSDTDSGSHAQILVRETPSSDAIVSKVICTSRPDKNSNAFEASILGMTMIRSDGMGQTSIRTRQFQAFVNSNGQGLVSLNPRLQARPMNSLFDYLAAMGSDAHLLRLEDQTYVLKLERESNGIHSRMLIKYDFIPRG